MITPPRDPAASDQPEPQEPESQSAPQQARTVQPDDLDNLFEGVGEDEDPLAAMRENPDYAELIRELEYIASQARALFEPSAEAPSDAVWDKIASQLPPKSNP